MRAAAAPAVLRALGRACARLDGATVKPCDLLFSETTGRIVLTCRPAAAAALTERLGPHGLQPLGSIAAGDGEGGWLRVRRGEEVVMALTSAELRARFRPEALHGPPGALTAAISEVSR